MSQIFYFLNFLFVELLCWLDWIRVISHAKSVEHTPNLFRLSAFSILSKPSLFPSVKTEQKCTQARTTIIYLPLPPSRSLPIGVQAAPTTVHKKRLGRKRRHSCRRSPIEQMIAEQWDRILSVRKKSNPEHNLEDKKQFVRYLSNFNQLNLLFNIGFNFLIVFIMTCHCILVILYW